MLASVERNETLSPNDATGRSRECELCGERRTCIERRGMVTCRDCQVELLPRRGVL